MEEVEIRCPFCGEFFSVVVDLSVDDQDYIEDCYVCCRPIRLHAVCEDGEFVSLAANRE